MTRLLTPCWCVLVYGLLSLPATATAQPASGALDLTAVGTCPTREAVMGALAPVVGRMPARAGGASPRVADLGDRFEVSAAGQRGQYVDAARDCVERARIAAVFIALALNPPVYESRPPPAPAVPPPPPPPPPVTPPAVATARPPVPEPDVSARAEEPSGGEPSTRWVAVGIAGRVDGASAGNDPASTVMAAGADLRAALGRGAWGGFLAAGVLAPTTAKFDALLVRQQRFPFSLGVLARAGAPGGFQVAGELGVALALFTLRGQQLASGPTETRLDVGGRLAVALRFPSVGAGRIVAFTDVHAEVYPKPYHLDVSPLGPIGDTSRLWLGASVGAWFEGL